jgi:hypothetical protein
MIANQVNAASVQSKSFENMAVILWVRCGV